MTAIQVATLFFCLALCLGLAAVASQVSRPDAGRPSLKTTVAKHQAAPPSELAARKRVHQAQKRHLARWLAEMATICRNTNVVVRDAGPPSLDAARRAHAATARKKSAPSGERAARSKTV